MYKVVNATTGKLILTSIPTEREAKTIAASEAQTMLHQTPEGRRVIGWCKGKWTWEITQQYVMVERMIGDWIFIKEPENAPEETTDDYEVVFILKRKVERRLIGMYDAEEGEFVDQGYEYERRYSPERVLAYMFLPGMDEEDKDE